MLFMQDTVGINNGVLHDERIERLLAYTVKGHIHHDDYDTLLNEVVREFLIEDAPMFYASKTQPHDASVLVYIAALGFCMTIANRNGPTWPGDFDYAPDCCYAVSIAYPFQEPDDEDFEWSEYGPGLNLNLAGLAALVQLARESCEIDYNQGKLLLN